MASIRYYQNGAGGSSGADLAVLKPTYASGNYWYVKYATGTDAGGTAGQERAKPLKTLNQAFTNASANDTIVLLSGHVEATAGIVVNKAGLKIVGEGTGSTRPQLTNNYIAATIAIQAAGVIVDNIDFPASTGAPTDKIAITSTFAWVRNCTFEQGTLDNVRAVSLATGAGSVLITGSTFTALGAGPNIAIQVVNAITGLFMDSVTFDGGSGAYWSDYAFKGGAAVTNLTATRISQLNGSHAIMATGTTGSWQQQASTGDSRVDWTP